jgi:nucleoside-diphosphate-sugar epimerase
MPQQPGTVLIAGGSGVIGAAAVEHFASLGWNVIGVSRRRPDTPDGVSYAFVPLDLMDAAACRAAASGFADVTHVVYAALFEKPGLVAGWLEQDQMQTNLAMMRNLMDPLLASAKGLRHVSVLQGTKAYGAHVHPIKIPPAKTGRATITRTSTGCRRTSSARSRPARTGASPSGVLRWCSAWPPGWR